LGVLPVYVMSITQQLATVENVRYTRGMSRIIRSAMLQARVRPEIKFASESVLRRIGLNMTEAMELFLRRMIIDQKLPFEVVALDDATFRTITEAWQKELLGKGKGTGADTRKPGHSRSRTKGG
jgi:DNA-damage-inducible protein J